MRERAARDERLEAALRQNLRRRKAQARLRAEAHEAPAPAAPTVERQSKPQDFADTPDLADTPEGRSVREQD